MPLCGKSQMNEDRPGPMDFVILTEEQINMGRSIQVVSRYWDPSCFSWDSSGNWRLEKSLYLYKSVVTFHPLRILGSFLLKHLPVPLWSLSCKSAYCTLAPGTETLSGPVRHQHLQVWCSIHQNIPWCPKHPILSCHLQCVQPVFFFWWCFGGVFLVPLFLLVVVCLAFVLLLLFFGLWWFVVFLFVFLAHIF